MRSAIAVTLWDKVRTGRGIVERCCSHLHKLLAMLTTLRKVVGLNFPGHPAVMGTLCNN